MPLALTFIHGLKGTQCFDSLARPDVIWESGGVGRRSELEMAFCENVKRFLAIDMGSVSKATTKYQTNLVLDPRNGAESIFATVRTPKQLLYGDLGRTANVLVLTGTELVCMYDDGAGGDSLLVHV